MEASRRIYQFDWVSDIFIGDSVQKAKFFALSFVGSGFKTLAFMLILVFWNVAELLFFGVLDFFTSLVS